MKNHPLSALIVKLATPDTLKSVLFRSIINNLYPKLYSLATSLDHLLPIVDSLNYLPTTMPFHQQIAILPFSCSRQAIFKEIIVQTADLDQ